MATITRNETIYENWEPKNFSLLSNVSQVTFEYWPAQTPPTANDTGHPLIPGAGLSYNVFEDDGVIVYFRSRNMNAVATITEHL